MDETKDGLSRAGSPEQDRGSNVIEGRFGQGPKPAPTGDVSASQLLRPWRGDPAFAWFEASLRKNRGPDLENYLRQHADKLNELDLAQVLAGDTT